MAQNQNEAFQDNHNYCHYHKAINISLFHVSYGEIIYFPFIKGLIKTWPTTVKALLFSFLEITEIDIYFQLDFPSTATTTDYAIVTMGQDLTAATVCFWMKSDDTHNQGTPFSYATADGDNIFTLTDYDG